MRKIRHTHASNSVGLDKKNKEQRNVNIIKNSKKENKNKAKNVSPPRGDVTRQYQPHHMMKTNYLVH